LDLNGSKVERSVEEVGKWLQQKFPTIDLYHGSPDLLGHISIYKKIFHNGNLLDREGAKFYIELKI
jgi:hypothetical protein